MGEVNETEHAVPAAETDAQAGPREPEAEPLDPAGLGEALRLLFDATRPTD